MKISWTKEETFLMQEALKQAHKAYDKNEVPIGAIISNENNTIIGIGYNCIESKKCQTAHAELEALAMATQKKDNWRLDGCTLFVTLEPCTMCFAALRLSRVKRVVFGASSPVFGYKQDQDTFLKVEQTKDFLIQGGLEKEACQNLLKKFFEQKR